MNPGYVLVCARFIEVQHKPGFQLLAGVIHYLDSSPRALARGLHASLPALCVRGEGGNECQPVRVQYEMHAGIVDQSCLVNVDIEAVIRLHLKGGLHTGHRERSLGGVAAEGLLIVGPDFGKTALGVLIFLGVVVRRNPDSLVVSGHCKFGKFILDAEICHASLLREFVAEAESVIEKSEADGHPSAGCCLQKIDGQFVVIIAYFGFLAPYRSPGLVE